MTKTETLLREIVLKQDEMISFFDYRADLTNADLVSLYEYRGELSALKASLEEEKKKLYPGVWYM